MLVSLNILRLAARRGKRSCEKLGRFVSRRSCVAALVLLAPVGGGPGAAAEDTYPSRPIRLVVPFPAGGINDVIARLYADSVRTTLGSVVIENHGGAGGSIGANIIAHAEPNGYNLLLGSGATHIVGPFISPHQLYDPQADLAPVAILGSSGLAIAVHPSLPVHTLQELVGYIRSTANVAYGSAGVGSATHLGAELFMSLIGKSDAAHVPYRGGAPALADLVGGQIQLAFLNVSGQLVALHRDGKLRLLAVTSAERSQAAPDIGTAQEAGVPGMVAVNFAGLFAPTGTPRPLIQKLATETEKALAQPTVQAALTNVGLDVQKDSGPDAAARFVASEIARWAPVMKKINLKAEAQ